MMNLAKNQTPGVGNIMPIGHFWSKLSSGYEIARTYLIKIVPLGLEIGYFLVKIVPPGLEIGHFWVKMAPSGLVNLCQVATAFWWFQLAGDKCHSYYNTI